MNALAPRERMVAEMVAQGLTAKEIAYQLGVSEQTVKNYKSAIYQKLNVRNAPEMVRALAQPVGNPT